MEEHLSDRFAPTAQGPAFRQSFREHPLFHLALLSATFITTTIAGGVFSDSGGFLGRGRFSDGLPFSVPLLIILGTHEMGHYLMCRRYGLAATLPYFIPSPLLFPPHLFNFVGTFGAVIRIKEPIRSKRQLIDIGAAGPLFGFLMSLPFLLYGVTRAQSLSPGSPPGALFSYPLAVKIAQRVMGTSNYTSSMVKEDATFMAAWFGLLVTALNLLPIGQLDGGHVIRAVAGRFQPRISKTVIVAAAAMAYWGPAWITFLIIVAVFIGIHHPRPDDDDEPLDVPRRLVAFLCFLVFVLCFTLAPIHFP